MIEAIFVEGLIYALMVLGVYITFRILDFPDLSVDGSFPLGAAITAILIKGNANFIVIIFASFLGGLLAGFLTSFIHTKLKIPNLLAGILTMTMLYSINIRILGNKSNLPLLKNVTILSFFENLFSSVPKEIVLLVFFIVVVFLVKLLLDLFFHTDIGLILRAMGNNQQMVINQGINPDTIKLIGVGLSNGLVSLSGSFACQFQKFADVNLGQGIVVSGLASVMIGELVLPTNSMFLITLRVIIGSIIYRGIMFFGREYGFLIGMTPNDLKLITGLLIIFSLYITKLLKPKNI